MVYGILPWPKYGLAVVMPFILMVEIIGHGAWGILFSKDWFRHRGRGGCLSIGMGTVLIFLGEGRLF